MLSVWGPFLGRVSDGEHRRDADVWRDAQGLPEQRFRLVQSLADKFCLLEGEVESSLDRHGVPILAGDVSVSSCDRALVMGAIL